MSGSGGSADTSYIYASGATSTNGSEQLSNWLVTPEINFSTTNTFSFTTRTSLGNPNFELLEVRLSTSGASVDVGDSVSSVGVFTNLLGSVGNLTGPFSTYPGALSANNAFQQFNFTLTPQTGSGRVAFRYASPVDSTEMQSPVIAIDSVVYDSVPEPAMASSLSGFAVLSLAQFFKRKRKLA